MTNAEMTELTESIVRMIARAAKVYLEKNKLTVTNEKLAECIKNECKQTTLDALAAAREAYDAGLREWGNAAFMAELAQSGIRAAKVAAACQEV